MRLFAVMLLLTYTYTTTAQTTDTLKPATTEKKWGIGVMYGGFYNIIPGQVQLDATNEFPSTSHANNSFSIDFICNYKIRRFQYSTILNYNRYNIINVTDTTGINGNPNPQLISNEKKFTYNLFHISQRFTPGNWYVGKRFNINIGVSADAFILSKININEIDIAKNNTVLINNTNTVIPGGFGVGLGLYTTVKYSFLKNFSVGFDLTSLYIYSKGGGLRNIHSVASDGTEYNQTKYTSFKNQQFLPIRPAISITLNL
jgi:hypothetical protein